MNNNGYNPFLVRMSNTAMSDMGIIMNLFLHSVCLLMNGQLTLWFVRYTFPFFVPLNSPFPGALSKLKSTLSWCCNILKQRKTFILLHLWRNHSISFECIYNTREDSGYPKHSCDGVASGDFIFIYLAWIYQTWTVGLTDEWWYNWQC